MHPLWDYYSYWLCNSGIQKLEISSQVILDYFLYCSFATWLSAWTEKLKMVCCLVQAKCAFFFLFGKYSKMDKHLK